MGYCYKGNRLCCDVCGKADGTTRRHRCPYGYCPSIAACPECRKAHAEKFRAKAHVKCKTGSEELNARWAREKSLVESGIPVRCSAMSVESDGKEAVHVLFRVKDGSCVGYYMKPDTYDAIPLGTPATPEDYRRHGELVEAAGTF